MLHLLIQNPRHVETFCSNQTWKDKYKKCNIRILFNFVKLDDCLGIYQIYTTTAVAHCGFSATAVA
jgi:hypothetical protein